jgi:hypothetical protein
VSERSLPAAAEAQGANGFSLGPYERDEIFGDGTAGSKIADVLASTRPAIQRELHHTPELLDGLLPTAAS